MSVGIQQRLGRLALVMLIWSLTPISSAADAELFDTASSGILELAGHSRLKIEGIHGTVFIRAGKTDEMRYSAATRTSLREPHPVALWLRGGTVIFRPVEGAEDQEIILEIALSEGVRVEIDKQGGKVQVSGVLGDILVRAHDSEVDIRGAGERVSVDLEGGSLRLENLEHGVVVDGSDLDPVLLARIRGGVELNLVRSRVEASNIGSPFQIDLDETEMSLSSSTAGLVGSATESRLELVNVKGGAKLVLEETPLTAERCGGALEVETDETLNLTSLKGTLVVTGYAPVVNVTGHTGSVNVTSRDAEITLSNIGGAVDLQGEMLNVRLDGLQDTLSGRLVGSQLTAAGVKGAIDLTNDFGDLVFRNVDGDSTITNRNGSVQMLDLAGTLEIDADGPEVRVRWRSIGRAGDSRIVNSGGDLYVEFPIGASGRVEATASSIESDLEDLTVRGDGRSASGLLGGRDSPSVTLEASGRLVVSQPGN